MADGKLIPLRRVGGAHSAIAELSDEALVAAVGTGDSAALGALFDRFHLAVYRFAARLPLVDDAAKDDLVQSTFLEIRRVASAFRGEAAVRTWILGIAANVARGALRSEIRLRARQRRFLTIAEDRGDDRLSPSDQIDRRRLLAQIADAMGGLSRDQQIAFVMCDLEQLSGVEVARVLGIPEGTLWRRLHTARRAIRAAIGDREGDEGDGPRAPGLGPRDDEDGARDGGDA